MSGSGGIRPGVGRVAARYRAMVAVGEVSEDIAQLRLAERLDRLDVALAERELARKGRALGWLFRRPERTPLKGFYIHGGVGRGKTMLMDTFFAAAEIGAKRRDHFHAFMTGVHDRIHTFRQAVRAGNTNGNGDDPIVPVAIDIASRTRLLCLDEFAVEDIADAMILSRLFAALFDKGLVLVATSNTAPEELYRNGLNRTLFLPFIEILRRHVEVVAFDVATDYRLARLGETTAWVSPLGAEARLLLDGLWRSLARGAPGEPTAIRVKGREVVVPKAADGVARFAFSDLCEAPLGAADFAAIADAFPTVMIDGVPIIAPERRDVARRFINLVDVFYDRGVKLVLSAAAEPDELYRATSGNEAFAFRRTVSRLTEMRTAAWLGVAPPLPAGAPTRD